MIGFRPTEATTCSSDMGYDISSSSLNVLIGREVGHAMLAKPCCRPTTACRPVVLANNAKVSRSITVGALGRP
jgi:hypothetical protein